LSCIEHWKHDLPVIIVASVILMYIGLTGVT